MRFSLRSQAEVRTKADAKHRHSLSELDGVREEIATRAPLSHVHHMSQVCAWEASPLICVLVCRALDLFLQICRI
jgi:hypothetical protein